MSQTWKGGKGHITATGDVQKNGIKIQTIPDGCGLQDDSIIRYTNPKNLDVSVGTHCDCNILLNDDGVYSAELESILA